MKKTVKDLKIGDNLYFLDTDNCCVSVNKVINLEEDEDDSVKITWEKEEYQVFSNYCLASKDDSLLFEEPDYDSEDFNYDDEDEEDGRNIYLNREDVISWLKREIAKLQRTIDSLP